METTLPRRAVEVGSLGDTAVPNLDVEREVSMKKGYRVFIGLEEGTVDSVEKDGSIKLLLLDSGAKWYRPEMRWVRRIS